jgi:hypothetical protein
MSREALSRLFVAGRCWIGCAAILLTAACSDSSTDPPMSVEGSYELLSYGGEGLPVVLRVIVDNPTTPGGEGASCEDRLAAMTLVLNSQSRYTSTSERRLVCDNGDPDQVSHPEESGTYETQGSALALTSDGASGSVVVSKGEFDASFLTITQRVTTTELGASTDDTRLKFDRAP